MMSFSLLPALASPVALPQSDASGLVRLIGTLHALPGWLVHLALGAGAAVENIFPVIPADSFVVVGGIMAGRGMVPLWSIVLVTWVANLGGALLVYLAGRRWGRDFFITGVGRHALSQGQLERVERFHRRHGALALFLVRLLPGLRVVAPAFAGLTGMSPLRTALPVGLAAGLWYGGLTWAGFVAGENLDALAGRIDALGSWLWWVTGAVVVGLGFWWSRSRRDNGGRGG